MNVRDLVLLDGVRTPMGEFGGSLASLTANELGAHAAKALLDRNPNPDRTEVIDAISGNICRCTGYEPIINAILAAAADQRRAISA